MFKWRKFGRTAILLLLSLLNSRGLAEPKQEPKKPDQLSESTETLTFSPDGKHLMIGGGYPLGPGEFAVMELQTGKFKYRNKQHRLAVHGGAFSPNGKLLATGGGDGELNLWDAATGKLQSRLIGHRHYVDRLIFTKDGKYLVSASLNLIKVWDVTTAKPLVTYRFPLTEKALESDFPETKDERAKVTIEIKEPIRKVRAIALSPDDKTLFATGGKDVRAWDLLTGKERPLKIEHDMATFILSPDGKTIFTAAGYEVDDLVKAWDVASGKGRKFEQRHKKEAIVFLLCTPDGKTLVSDSNDGTTWVWDVGTGKAKGSLKTSKKSSFSAIVMSPNGKTLVTAKLEEPLRFWDIASGKEIAPLWENP